MSFLKFRSTKLWKQSWQKNGVNVLAFSQGRWPYSIKRSTAFMRTSVSLTMRTPQFNSFNNCVMYTNANPACQNKYG